MEAPEQSVLEQLVALEKESLQPAEREEAERCRVLRITILTLRSRRERLQQQVLGLQMLKDKLHRGLALEDGEAELQKSWLEAWLLQLKDLRRGGYELREDGKSRLVRIHTAFQGVYQETYTLELDLTRSLKISRHDLPPYFPLESLTAETLQKDLKACLESLSRGLNALVGRRRQLALVRELVGCVEVMESNQLCNTLVLMCRSGGEKPTAVLCSLEYRDLGRSLPTHASIQSHADELLPESAEWRKNRELLLESPLHHALLAMKSTGSIS